MNTHPTTWQWATRAVTSTSGVYAASGAWTWIIPTPIREHDEFMAIVVPSGVPSVTYCTVWDRLVDALRGLERAAA